MQAGSAKTRNEPPLRSLFIRVGKGTSFQQRILEYLNPFRECVDLFQANLKGFHELLVRFVQRHQLISKYLKMFPNSVTKQRSELGILFHELLQAHAQKIV